MDNNNNYVKSPGSSDLKNYASFSEGIASLNGVVNTQDITNLSSMDSYDKFSQMSESRSFITCDAYK